jgi:hypothetical protein
MYRWDFDDPARQHFASLSSAGQEELAAFMNAAVLVDPIDINAIQASPLTQPSYSARCISADITKDSSRSWSTHQMTSCSSSRSSGSANE